MNESPAPERSLIGPLRIAVVVLVVIVAGLILWALLKGDDDGDSGSGGGNVAGPRIVSIAELSDLAAATDTPLYWAGEIPGTELEYSETEPGALYVRYLTGGAEAGDPRPNFLTVATYPLADPVAALRANARRTDTELQRAAGGGVVWVDPNRPSSVYLAQPGSEYQVEVYDPSSRRALDVTLSGDIEQVE